MNPMRHDVMLDPARKAAMRSILEEAIATEPPRYARFRTPVAVGVGTAVALAGGTATAYVISQRPVTEEALVHCFSRAELTPDGAYPGTAVAVATQNGDAVPIDDALTACNQLWQDGLLDQDAAIGAPMPEPATNQDGVAPSPMTVCVMPDGAAAVVPGTANTCNELGLPLHQG
jgi:hypothetical protein